MTPALSGVVHDLPEADYFAHPALSVSGAKKLLPPSCPARFRHEQLHGQPHKAVFDIGHAAHTVVLGAGAEIKVVDAPDWRSKAAKADADEIRAAGHTPLLVHEWRLIVGMVEAVRAHPIAGPLFEPGTGTPEVSMFWRDVASDIDRRARVDWLPHTDGGQVTLVDLKTCASGDLASIRSSVAKFRYEMQHAWYVDGAHALEVADDVRFRFVFVEKTPPFLVTVVELDAQAEAAGRARNDEALRIYRECVEWDMWPGYSDDVVTVSLPPWALGGAA